MSLSAHNFLVSRERERNASTRDAFSKYEQHRARQMALLCDLRGERIAILGAGNCNDIELAALADAFTEIHLFDIDVSALTSAVARHSDKVRTACHLHEADLTGVAGFLEGWKENPPDTMTAQVAAWEKLSPLVSEVGEFDVVLSSCLLSQVAINLRDYFGLVPALNSALPAGIVGHVVLAAALVKPGGTLLIVSDCITNRFPIYEETEQHGALQAIFKLASQGAAFPGTDPQLIANVLSGTDMQPPEFKDAWIWELEQSYLVYALQAVRRS